MANSAVFTGLQGVDVIFTPEFTPVFSALGCQSVT